MCLCECVCVCTVASVTERSDEGPPCLIPRALSWRHYRTATGTDPSQQGHQYTPPPLYYSSFLWWSLFRLSPLSKCSCSTVVIIAMYPPSCLSLSYQYSMALLMIPRDSLILYTYTHTRTHTLTHSDADLSNSRWQYPSTWLGGEGGRGGGNVLTALSW